MYTPTKPISKKMNQRKSERCRSAMSTNQKTSTTGATKIYAAKRRVANERRYLQQLEAQERLEAEAAERRRIREAANPRAVPGAPPVEAQPKRRRRRRR